jgi:hypothetical protein
MNDTRKTAGAYLTHVSSFPSEASTAEPGTVTVIYDKIDQANTNTSASDDTSSKAFPVYNDGDNIRSMTLTDMYDTFIYPVIDTLVTGSTGTAQAGTYRIHTGTSLSGHTLISSTPVFSDTRANIGEYTAGGIPEGLDQPFTVTNYYLFRVDSGGSVSYPEPVQIDSNNDLRAMTTASFDSILQNCVRHSASEIGSHSIRYSVSGTGTNRGSGMSNTILNGSGNYQQRYVNTNDYRAQEFPNGSVEAESTYYLRIYKV